MSNRYQRQILLPEISHSGQQKLAKARVLVVGAGGLGCPALQYLTAAGVGHIGIVDPDRISLSNLQRQILFQTRDIGLHKALVAAGRLQQLNDEIVISPIPDLLTKNNALELFSEYDIILDCTDNIPARYMMNDACVLLDKIYIYGAIHKFEGQVSVFNYNNGPNYRDLFPQPPAPGSVPTCNEIGVLGILPGIIGMYQANEALKIILELGEILGGKLLCFNALNMHHSRYEIMHRKDMYEIPNEQQFKEYDYPAFCHELSDEITEVGLADIRDKINTGHTLFVDVRAPGEQPNIEFDNLMRIPLSVVAQEHYRIPGDVEIITFCHSGVRSVTAAQILKREYPGADVKSLKASIFEFINFIHHVH